jgi:tetratricopeptide (TPR) repeat protein
LRAVSPDAAREAEKELFAARYERAAELYGKVVREDPAWAPGYYGLVRALLGDHRPHEAYTAAADGLKQAPQSAEGQTAAGLAEYRRGDLPRAEAYFRKARQIDPKYAYALSGLASIYYAVSKFKTGNALVAQAFRAAPTDPQLLVAWAGTLQGAEHLAALERALAMYEPASREARRLYGHLAMDKSAGGRKVRQLASPYQSYDIELVQIGFGARHTYAVGVKVRLNNTRTVRLMLDTGSSGVSLSPKAAEKAGLETLGDVRSEFRGLGDKKPQEAFAYLAESLEIGDLRFNNFPLKVSQAATTDDFDGLMGADVFHMFRVTIDFPKRRLQLAPNSSGPPGDEAVDAADPLATGFTRMLRFGHMLTVETKVNEGTPQLFLLDSGSSGNLVDNEAAQESTKVKRDYNAGLRGVQGSVTQLSRASKVCLIFAGFKQENLDMLSTSLQAMGDSTGVGIAGVIGMPVLWQMKLTIDYRNGALRLERTGAR